MATIFLSYRRTDGPQACRVYDWLSQRFGNDAVFMDVTAIPFAVSFTDFLREAVANSKVLIALIGTQWLSKINEPDDPVRMEIEVAIGNHIPVLPVLIGNTSMPDPEELPASISMVASRNAITVGVLHDFDAHMQLLLPEIESILGSLAAHSETISAPNVIRLTCEEIISYLYGRSPYDTFGVDWRVVGTHDFGHPANTKRASVTLFLHRVVRFAEVVELHFMLSFWARDVSLEHMLAGWVMSQLEQTPIMPEECLASDDMATGFYIKIRRSDEDARQVWKMITDEPLRLSLTYVATVSPKRRD